MPHAIQIRQTGGPEVLNWTPIKVGEPGSGQVRLRQVAAGLNYRQSKIDGFLFFSGQVAQDPDGE